MNKIIKNLVIVLLSIVTLVLFAASVYIYRCTHYWQADYKKTIKAGFNEKQIILDDGSIINYAEGPNNGKALLLIHGQTGAWQDYSTVLPILSKNWHIFAVDCYGHGESSHNKEKYYLDKNGNDLIWFVNNVIKKDTVVSGHSSGGLLAAYVAAYGGDFVTGAVLEDPPLFSTEKGNFETTFVYIDTFKPMHNYIHSEQTECWEAYYMRHCLWGQLYMPKAMDGLANYAQQYYKNNPEKPVQYFFMPGSINSMFLYTKKYDLQFGENFYDYSWHSNIRHIDLLKNISVPTIFLHNKELYTDDGILMAASSNEQARKAVELINDCELIEVSGNHNIHRFNSKVFINAINKNGNEINFRYGLNTEPVTLDPLNPANTADGRSILFNVFEGLVKPDSSGSLVPAVAQSYRIEQDALVYVFAIREGIQFHDGTTLKPGDVAFSLNTAMKAGFVGFDRIAAIEVSGPQEIRLTLKTPDTEFLPYLTVGIVPEHNSDREKKPVGSGPFVIKSYTPQQSLTLVKNPHYWQDGAPRLDRVTVVFAPDTDALLTGLLGSNIEGAGVTGAEAAMLDPDKFEIIPWYSNMVQLMALNNGNPPLNDPQVRRAINYAIDIPGIIDAAFYGNGEPSGSPIIPGLKNAYEESLRAPYPHDVERAKKLLAQAGHPDGFPLEITVPSIYTMHVDTAQVIVGQLAEVGIKASIRLVDWATWLDEAYRGRKYQATIISLDAVNVSPRSFLSRYLSDAQDNFINFKNADFDRTYRAALAEVDEGRRITLYKEAQRIISEAAASVYIQDIMGFRVFAKGRVGGVINYPLYIIDFASMYQN